MEILEQEEGKEVGDVSEENGVGMGRVTNGKDLWKHHIESQDQNEPTLKQQNKSPNSKDTK